MEKKIKLKPKEIADEYNLGTEFKNGIGKRGIAEQSKINERFFVGDQWHGANVGADKPLVRRNVIKRIGEYKMASIAAAPIAINYIADGVPDANITEQIDAVKQGLFDGNMPNGEVEAPEISVICSALSDYQRVTAERLKFNAKMEQLLRNAYISGTGIGYTYWESLTETGLYADASKQVPIKGDIAFEVLDVENVVFGDPNCDDVQTQPYITIAVRRELSDVIREAKRNRISPEEIASIKPDENEYAYAGDRGEEEPKDSSRVTVYTKIYKEWDKDAMSYKVMAVKVTKTAYVRKPFDMKLKLYPIAKMSWDRRRSSVYGDSEITNMIPNQIAINRALTAAVWSAMLTGMPITIVNGDVVPGDVSNNPGQVIKVYGTDLETQSAVRYINPPNYAIALNKAVEDLASFTLSDSGANDAALGNLRPDNAAAIIQMREAAMAPLQIYMNRYYDVCEDIARIWADFWLNLYGNRKLRVEDNDGVHYIAFDGERYRNLCINARVDVGASTLWSESVVISTLDNMLERGLITFEQYLDRLPGGLIPNVTGLKNDLRKQSQVPPVPTDGELTDEEILAGWSQQNPKLYNRYMSLSPEEQQMLMSKAKGGQASPVQEVGDI